ncbi:phosphohydrolase [Rhodopseudomonas sp. BR0G17]|uniref:phosphohydrolase n=1 Tax=Rhodopseudomonas sp. BR0G17 TaxID=2269368 RepID=UPI0013DF4A44|nr:phosphohydrolase [Rhodopseudomonas sp. BR0G17]NEW96623.1 phosphohydrolase [Rhodopseudomonas sp. BR0G17]
MPPAPRVGDWIQTFTGGAFWPLDPRAEEISVLDITAGLARECRFGGQCLRFYSVAEHSVLMYRVATDRCWSARQRRAVLLHDASEGLGLRDIPRPIKGEFSNYKAIESRVMRVVAAKFDFDWPLDPSIKQLDNEIGGAEQLQNMAPAVMPWGATADHAAFGADPLGVRLEYWSPDRAFIEFQIAAAELGLWR